MLNLGTAMLLGLTLLGSAAPRYWKPGTTIERREHDRIECLKGTSSEASRGVVLRIDRDIVDRCMIRRGYAIRGDS